MTSILEHKSICAQVSHFIKKGEGSYAGIVFCKITSVFNFEWQQGINIRVNNYATRCNIHKNYQNLETNNNCFFNLNELYPNLHLEWDEPEVLFNLKEIKLTKTYNWKCRRCNRKWKTSINQRIIFESGCRSCSKRLMNLNDKNKLSLNVLQLVSEWDFDTNKLKPSNYPTNSHYKAHWICSF